MKYTVVGMTYISLLRCIGNLSGPGAMMKCLNYPGGDMKICSELHRRQLETFEWHVLSLGASAAGRAYLDQGVHALQHPLHLILSLCGELLQQGLQLSSLK